MGDEIYARRARQALVGARKGNAFEEGVTLPSLIGSVVITVHQSCGANFEADEGFKVHVATDVQGDLFRKVIERLYTEYQEATRESGGYVHPEA